MWHIHVERQHRDSELLIFIPQDKKPKAAVKINLGYGSRLCNGDQKDSGGTFTVLVLNAEPRREQAEDYLKTEKN